ncbi:hypothetical protein BX600DRAFT_373824, partial [Xylariales sp. PMI_506]
LNPSKNQIRILEVQPARDVEDRVVCRLVNVTLTEDLEFLAISSLLGDPSETENIVINGRKLPIPATLAQALRHVRAVFSQLKNKNSYSNDAGGLLPPQTRRGGPGGRRPSATAPSVLRVWLDFLCIDRQDARETSEQLMHMGKVYRAARMTIGWLGMNEVRTAGSESDSSSGSVDLTHMAAEVMRELEMALPANYGDPDDRAEHPENYHPVWQWQTRMQHLWGGLRDFVDRPYFHRTWILDEIGMARYPALLVGDRLVSWAQVLLLNRVMEELRNEASYLEQVLSPELRAVVDGWPMGTIYTLLKHDESARKQQADKKQL